MAIVKLKKEKYPEERDVKKLIDYICNLYKCDHVLYGGRNIIAPGLCVPESLAEQFLVVQYGRRFIKRLFHVVISFDQILDAPDLKFVYHVGNAIMDMYPDYQSFFTVHEDNSHLHIHMVINNCAILPEKENLTTSFCIYDIQNLVDRMVYAHLGIPEPVYRNAIIVSIADKK